MKFKLYTPQGSFSKEIDFGLPIFEGDKGLQAVKEAVVAYRASKRLGTHSTKTRGEVSGGGKKPWRQKGTGRARAGSTRSPIWVGGGVVFGPKPRDYSKKINAKVKGLAFSRALFDRASAGDIEVIEEWAPVDGKAKNASQIMGRIVPLGKILLVDAPFSDKGVRAARNLERVSLQNASSLNALDLVQYAKIVVSLKALEAISSRITPKK